MAGDPIFSYISPYLSSYFLIYLTYFLIYFLYIFLNRKISVNEITLGKIFKNSFCHMTWQNPLLQHQNNQKSKLHHATKPCSEVIHHFVENNVITSDIMACLNGQ